MEFGYEFLARLKMKYQHVSGREADQQRRMGHCTVVSIHVDEDLQVAALTVVFQALTEPRRVAGGSIEAAIKHRYLRGDQLQLGESNLTDLTVEIPARARWCILLVCDLVVGAGFRRYKAQRTQYVRNQWNIRVKIGLRLADILRR